MFFNLNIQFFNSLNDLFDFVLQFSDDYQPYIRYYFNNNCNGNLDSEYCSKTWWSVNVEVEDRQSGKTFFIIKIKQNDHKCQNFLLVNL